MIRWGFPKIGVPHGTPSSHPFIDWFSLINHPAIGYPICGNIQFSAIFMLWDAQWHPHPLVTCSASLVRYVRSLMKMMSSKVLKESGEHKRWWMLADCSHHAPSSQGLFRVISNVLMKQVESKLLTWVILSGSSRKASGYFRKTGGGSMEYCNYALHDFVIKPFFSWVTIEILHGFSRVLLDSARFGGRWSATFRNIPQPPGSLSWAEELRAENETIQKHLTLGSGLAQFIHSECLGICWFDVVWNMNSIFPYIGNVIIPTD